MPGIRTSQLDRPPPSAVVRTSAQNAWTIEALHEGRSRVTSRVDVDLAWWAWMMTPMVRGRLTATHQSLLEQLDAHVSRRV